jgi:hypothetical protein
MRGFTGKRYIAAIAAAALALGAYILAYWLEDGYNLRLDATREQYTVLSEGTKQALSGLQKKVFVYYVEGEERDLTYTLLKSYASASENLSVETVSAGSSEAAALGAAQRSVIVSDTDIMTASQSKRTAVLSVSDLYQDSRRTGISPGVRYFRGEQRITSAVKYVAQEKAGRVVFLSGQGENKPCDRLIADIEDMYYGAGFITAEAPLDPASNILAVIGPKEDISDAGYRNIKAFLDSGGHAVFFMDSMSVETGESEYIGDRLRNFKALIAGYGISIGSDVIIGGNPAQTYKSPVNVMPTVTEEGAEALCISGKPLRPVLSYAGVIELSQAEGAQTVPLLSTDISCRAVNAREPLNLDGESGTAGSFIAGALAKKDETSIVVFSSSSFITSSADYSYKGNSDLFLSTIKFLGSSQGPVYIPAKKLYDEADAAYRLSLNQDMKPLLMAAAAGVPAMAVFLGGLSRWAKRRRL